jgi:NAD(P)-dependent dehydrogenase (short-subunit alcohol dehydrogenase family)
MIKFEEKYAIVTGGGSGIGRATALAFANEGVGVVVADVNVRGGEETARLISDRGIPSTFVKTDVSSSKDVENMVRHAKEKFGGFDYAFNNAGVEGHQGSLVEGSEQNWDSVLNVNLKGVWLCMKNQIPELLKRGGGAIVNNASILGGVGFAGAAPYTASKHGVLGLTKVAALEYATQNIRINAVCPGFIETPMLERAGLLGNAEVKQQIASLHPMKRMGTSQEIADAVLWLCSAKASFVTGQSIYVDGGYIIQ